MINTKNSTLNVKKNLKVDNKLTNKQPFFIRNDVFYLMNQNCVQSDAWRCRLVRFRDASRA